jgi:hypothetical protein
MTKQENEAIVRRTWEELFNKGNLFAILWAPSATMSSTPILFTPQLHKSFIEQCSPIGCTNGSAGNLATSI